MPGGIQARLPENSSEVFSFIVLNLFCSFTEGVQRLFQGKLLFSKASVGAQWLSGRVLDSRPKGRGFEPHRRHWVVSLSKNINPSLVLVQPRKTRPFITERLLMGRKESNQKQNKALEGVELFPGGGGGGGGGRGSKC